MHINDKLQKVIGYIDLQQRDYILLSKKNKKLKKEVDAIITATTLLKIKVESLITQK